MIKNNKNSKKLKDIFGYYYNAYIKFSKLISPNYKSVYTFSSFSDYIDHKHSRQILYTTDKYCCNLNAAFSKYSTIECYHD